MSTLPERPHLDWYRKAAKKKLAELRAKDKSKKLASAQLLVAREAGFTSWRKLKDAIDEKLLAMQSTDFFAAIRKDGYATIRKMLKANPKLANARAPAGETPLLVAAEINNPDTIDILLKHGADSKLKYGQSAHNALSWAVVTMAWEAAGKLVEHGVKLDLYCAAGMGDLEVVKSFFDKRGNVKRNASQAFSSRWDKSGKRIERPPTDPREVIADALYIAVRNGRANVAGYLLEKDVDQSFRAYLGGTLLHWAHFGGSKEVIEMLLDRGAKADSVDDTYGYTPRAFGICVPANWGIVRLVAERLKEDPTLLNVTEPRGTPLHEAAREGQVQVVKLLLACKARTDIKNREGKTALDLAIENNRDEVVNLLRV